MTHPTSLSMGAWYHRYLLPPLLATLGIQVDHFEDACMISSDDPLQIVVVVVIVGIIRPAHLSISSRPRSSMATLKGAIPLPKSKNADYHTLPDERTPTDHQHTLDLASSISTARVHDQGESVDEEEDEGHAVVRVGVNKGKGRAREDDDLDTLDGSSQHELANLQPPAHRPGSRANANNSSVDGDISVNTGPRDMYLSPHTAEMNRGVSPPSTSSSSTPTNNTSTSNSNHALPHGQTHSRHKSKNGRGKDPRWDLDTMETPNPGRSRSPLADEYTEPHWNSRTGTHNSSGPGYNNNRDGYGQRGMEVSESAGSFAGIGSGDYPSQSEEVEEERRIQDVS